MADQVIHHLAARTVPHDHRRIVLKGHWTGPAIERWNCHNCSYLSVKHYTAAPFWSIQPHRSRRLTASEMSLIRKQQRTWLNPRSVLDLPQSTPRELHLQKRDRSQLALGLILVLLGAGFFAVRQVPALRVWTEGQFDWPFYVIGAGVVILLIGLATG